MADNGFHMVFENPQMVQNGSSERELEITEYVSLKYYSEASASRDPGFLPKEPIGRSFNAATVPLQNGGHCLLEPRLDSQACPHAGDERSLLAGTIESHQNGGSIAPFFAAEQPFAKKRRCN
jgi:hypothetical protein